MAFNQAQYRNCNRVNMFTLLVTLSFYQSAIANHPPHKGEMDSLLASLKAVEKAAEALATELELPKAVNKPVLHQSDSKLNLEDIIKERKLRNILELISENNKPKLQDVHDESRGPRIFIVKENASDDYDNESESKAKVTQRNIQVHDSLRRQISRRKPDMEISSDEFKERRNAMQYIRRLGVFGASQETTPSGRVRSYVYEDDDDDYTTKKQLFQNTIDIFKGRDWDEPSPLRHTFPKYTDGPFDDDRSDGKTRKRITAMRPFEQKPSKSIPYNYSKEESWDGKMSRDADEIKEQRDESLDSPKKPFRSYGYDRYRSKNQLLGRTQIPYVGNRNVYEK